PEDHRACVLRLAGIYGPNRLLRRMESLQAGEPIAGDPRAWLNLVHVEDAVRAVLACEEHDRAGPLYLVCDDRPVPRQEYFTRLAELVGAPPPVFSGGPGTRTAGLNKRCRNRRLREELRVELAYPTIETGLPHAVQ
ncbi:MAG: SDR family oxidoreductase, partial [Planctomycetaceae bacterium]